MDEVNKIRKQIDEIDQQILDSLNKRAEWALKIKQTEMGKTAIRPERESHIIDEMIKNNTGPLPDLVVREIFTQIIAAFRDQLQLDKPISVSYLGPKGTYSEEAALKMFGSTIELQPENTISEVIRSVESGSTNLAVVPIENSSEGAVRETHRLLQDTSVKIVAEFSLPITHCLLSNNKDFNDIKTVYAHPQALGQCRQWLNAHLPNAKQVASSSNSAAAELAAKTGQSSAIAGAKAAEIYNLELIANGINDQPGNETRFIALSNLETRPTGKDKTSIFIVLNDKPGALNEVLGILAQQGISMTRLESQPYKKGQYAFYIDFFGHQDEPKIKEILEKINASTRFCQILGSYPLEAGR